MSEKPIGELPLPRIVPMQMINIAMPAYLVLGQGGSVFAELVDGKRVLVAQFNVTDWNAAEVYAFTAALVNGLHDRRLFDVAKDQAHD